MKPINTTAAATDPAATSRDDLARTSSAQHQASNPITITSRRGIDLEAAMAVARGNPERTQWIEAMLTPDGMSPGRSARAHARAFRFTEALSRAGYRVAERHTGPRGGRRFTLDGYDGARAGVIHTLKGNRGCFPRHKAVTCDCFDDLSDTQLKLTVTLHRRTTQTLGPLVGTDQLAHLVRATDDTILRTALTLYVECNTAYYGGPSLTCLLEPLTTYGLKTTKTAVELYLRAGATSKGGPVLGRYLPLLENHGASALRVAVELFASNGGTVDGAPQLETLVIAIGAALG